MAPDSPSQELAKRLRELREQHWPEERLTQAQLAAALAEGGHLSTATVSSWESHQTPKLPPPDRLAAYSRFFATRRSVEGGKRRLLPWDSLTDDERAVCAALETELLTLREEARRHTSRAERTAGRSWLFSDPGPLTIVSAQLPASSAGSLANPADPNYTELQSFADLDSLIELHGHIRAENPSMNVFFKASPRVVPDDLSGHVVLLGGIAWNKITERLSQMTVLPVRQVRDPVLKTGEIFITDLDGEEVKYLPKWRDEARNNLMEDVGLLARAPNPLNSNRTLTICNGVHSRGVLGAVRTLTDANLRDSNERYIRQNFGDSTTFAILMRVQVIEEQAMTPDFNSPDCVLYKWPPEAGT